MELIKINKLDLQQTSKFMDGLIAKTFLRAGQTSDEETLNFMSVDLTTIIKKRYWFLTVQDLEKAFENGIFGEYGEYYGLNVRTFDSWLSKYDKYRVENKQYERIEPSKMIESTATMTTMEIEKIMQEAFERKLDEYEQTGMIYDPGNAIYDWLDSKGKINLSKELKLELLDKAKRMLIAGKKQEMVKIDAELRTPYLVVINELENSQPTDKRIISKAKKLALEIVFKTLINNGTN